MSRYIILILIVSLGFSASCNTAFDPTTESCDAGEPLYCEDSQTIMECLPCRDEHSTYRCWKKAGCGGETQCRYVYNDATQTSSRARCLSPDDERFSESFTEDPLP